MILGMRTSSTGGGSPPASSKILQETGFGILLEDGSSFLLLE